MLVYDHSSGDLQNVTYGTADEQGYGFWHGSLGHMKLGPGKGFLISLMAEKGIAGYPRPDLLELGNETGIPVSSGSVKCCWVFDCSKSKGNRLLSTMSCFTILKIWHGTNRKRLISMVICRLLEPASAGKLFTATTRTPGSMLKQPTRP